MREVEALEEQSLDVQPVADHSRSRQAPTEVDVQGEIREVAEGVLSEKWGAVPRPRRNQARYPNSSWWMR